MIFKKINQQENQGEMPMKNSSKEMDVMEMKNRIRQSREDLPGDVMQSAELVLAAFEKKWDEVTQLLDQGADPRICRRGDAYGVESALYFALVDKQWNIAGRLYDAGDRLDDLIAECEYPLPWQVLEFLSFEMRCGRNYFLDESRTLSECCRCSAFEQIKKLIPDASQEELDKSIALTVYSWFWYYNDTDLYLNIINDLIRHGAKLSAEEKNEILKRIDRRFVKCPAVMRLDKKELDKIINVIQHC